MRRADLAKWFFEGALIVFSVLIALVINEAVDQRKTENEKRAAIERITLELERNAGILAGWRVRHAEFSRRLGAVSADGSSPLRDELLASGIFDLGLIAGAESFIDATLSGSAWEAARFTGLAGEFEYETVEKLTAVYTLQGILSDHTIARFSQLYFDRETHRRKSLDGTLIQFQLIVGELVGQETTLAQLYADALAHLEELPR